MTLTANLLEKSTLLIDQYQTLDGGASQKVSDLWCTYAATRALTWLNEKPLDSKSCANYMLECQNTDGGFAWQKGMRSDVWATYYCTQALKDLGHAIPNLPQLTEWLEKLLTPSGGFAMTPGQPADIWATYYSVRTFDEILQQKPAQASHVRKWLVATQQPSGGLGWSAAEHQADTRACYYGSLAWKGLGSVWPEGYKWQDSALIAWLQDRQTESGGFVFDETQQQPCMWATFRATKALEALGSEPRNKKKCIEWILSRQLPDSGFSRWDYYSVADVWACFCAVGALDALGVLNQYVEGEIKAQVVKFLQSCQLPQGGFTYREPEKAGDSLATSALCILKALDKDKGFNVSSQQKARYAWLRFAHMPSEGGVMYMPGRGAEVRCTLWSLAALDFAQETLLDRERLYLWFSELQNPDGGFGYWHGRGSDLTATVSALESLQYLGKDGNHQVDFAEAGNFLLECVTSTGVKFAPQGVPSLSTTCQGIRGLLIVGNENKARQLATLIPQHTTKLGGYAAQPGGVLPDLMSTYQAVLTLQTLQEDWETTDLSRFLNKIKQPTGGYSWSPLSREQAGTLAACLGELLQEAVIAKNNNKTFPLPKLNL